MENKNKHMDRQAPGNDKTSMAVYTFAVGESLYRIEAKVILSGEDIVVVCGGGTKYHIGAVSVAASNPKLKDPSQLEATASTIGIPGHKEDQIAREAALRLSKIFGVTVTVTVGIHINDASPDEINILVANFYKLFNQIIETLTNFDEQNNG